MALGGALYKTRALAVEEINLGRVRFGGQPVKPARDVKVGDVLSIRIGQMTREVEVKGLSNQRGPAPQAQLLYAETPASVTAREAAAEAAGWRRSRPTPSSKAGPPSRTGAAWRNGIAGPSRWTRTIRVDPARVFSNLPS